MISNYLWKDWPGTVRSTGAYIVFYQGEPIDYCAHIPGPVSQSSAESEYNTAFSAWMDPAHFGMLQNWLTNKDPDVVLEQSPLILLDIKSDLCMANNGKHTKHTRHIFRRTNFVIYS